MMASYQDLRFGNGSSRSLIATEKPRRVERKESALHKLFNPRRVERKSSRNSTTTDNTTTGMAGKEISFKTKTHVKERRHRMMGQSSRSEPVVTSNAPVPTNVTATVASSELRWSESKTTVSCDTTANMSSSNQLNLGSSNSSLRVREIMDTSGRHNNHNNTTLPRHVEEVEDEAAQAEAEETKEEIVTAAHFRIELNDDSEVGRGPGWKNKNRWHTSRGTKVTAEMDQKSCYTTRTGRSSYRRKQSRRTRANCEDKLPHMPGGHHESPTRDCATVVTESITRDDRTSVSEQPRRRTKGSLDESLKGRKACPTMRDRFLKDRSSQSNNNEPMRENSSRSRRSAPAQPRARPEMPSWRSEAPRRSSSWQEDHHYEYDHRRYEQRESRRYNDPRFDDYDYEYSASASQSRVDSRSHYQGSFDDYGSYHGSYGPRYYAHPDQAYDVYDHIARSTRSLAHHGYGGQEPVVVVIQMPPPSPYDDRSRRGPYHGRPMHHSYHGPPPPPRGPHHDHDYDAPKDVPPVVETTTNPAPEQEQPKEQPISPDDPVYIEIGAGVNARLRRTKETMAAIGRDFYVPATCMGCAADQFCIADCQYMYCCKCHSVSPLKECETNESTKQFVTREGVGMGFTHETLFEVQSELAEEKKKKNNVSC